MNKPILHPTPNPFAFEVECPPLGLRVMKAHTFAFPGTLTIRFDPSASISLKA